MAVKRLTLVRVNRAIAAEGIDAELVKGEGYYYFTGPDVELAFEQGVYVNTLNQLTLEQWLGEARDKMVKR